jgi:hypothetical protein
MGDIQAKAETEQEMRHRAVFCNLLLCWHHHVGKKVTLLTLLDLDDLSLIDCEPR